ncbi:MAG: hypothetical protein KY468_17155, partial [Armatimonadetes bacterium]|nr:hypothetical protein [Armatimonadota bacterium]
MTTRSSSDKQRPQATRDRSPGGLLLPGASCRRRLYSLTAWLPLVGALVFLPGVALAAETPAPEIPNEEAHEKIDVQTVPSPNETGIPLSSETEVQADEDNPKSKIQNPKSEDNALLLLPSYTDVRAVYGGQYIRGSGNEWKFRQYHTPLSRPVLRIFEWQTGREAEAFRLALVQPGWTDQGGALEYRQGGRRLTRMGLSAVTAEFHPELTILSADREVYKAFLTWLASPDGARAGLYLRNQDLSHDRRLLYPDYRAGDAIFNVNVPAGRFTLDLSAATREVKDRRFQIPAGNTTDPLRLTSRASTAALTYRTGSRASVRASVTATHARTSPDGNSSSIVADGTILALDAVATPTRRMTVRG